MQTKLSITPVETVPERRWAGDWTFTPWTSTPAMPRRNTSAHPQTDKNGETTMDGNDVEKTSANAPVVASHGRHGRNSKRGCAVVERNVAEPANLQKLAAPKHMIRTACTGLFFSPTYAESSKKLDIEAVKADPARADDRFRRGLVARELTATTAPVLHPYGVARSGPPTGTADGPWAGPGTGTPAFCCRSNKAGRITPNLDKAARPAVADQTEITQTRFHGRS